MNNAIIQPLFANPVPPPLYAASVFLTCIAMSYFLLRLAKKYGAVLIGIFCPLSLVFHFAWLKTDFPYFGPPQLIDSAIIMIPSGIIGVFLGSLLGIIAQKRTTDNQETSNRQNHG